MSPRAYPYRARWRWNARCWFQLGLPGFGLKPTPQRIVFGASLRSVPCQAPANDVLVWGRSR